MKRYLPALFLLVCGLIAGGYVAFNTHLGPTLWWTLSSRRSLTPEEDTAINSCNDPGWYGALKALHQRPSLPCDPPWLPTILARHANTTHRLNWLKRVANRSDNPSQRFDAAVALLRAKGNAVQDLVFLASNANVPAESRAALLYDIATRDLPDHWIDPILADLVALERLRLGDWSDIPRVVRLLHRRTGQGLGPPPGLGDCPNQDGTCSQLLAESLESSHRHQNEGWIDDSTWPLQEKPFFTLKRYWT
ncbi:MAG: hypothetical protein HN348_33420, partial [Proteobacteria bacterium]|nr:hypothetical protein [Pseudomonadota bacterium]